MHVLGSGLRARTAIYVLGSGYEVSISPGGNFLKSKVSEIEKDRL